MRPPVPQRRSSQRKAARRPAERRPARLLLLLLLLGAAGGSWLLGNGLQLPWSETRPSSAPETSPAELPVQLPDEHLPLRGTIYDRNLKELAVSYRLYSLFAQPLKLADRSEAAGQIAQILGADSAGILQRLNSEETTVELAKGLDARQAAAAAALRRPGIYCTASELRYYPGHAAAGQLLGFTSEGAGLSGCEALYDAALQPGGCRCAEMPELDCGGRENIDKGPADVILSLDMELQQQLEELLASYLRQQEAVSGSIVALSPESGQVLALVRQPGLDPNYFWQADEHREEHPLFAAEFFPELMQPLMIEAAALSALAETGGDGALLPATVSAPAWGLRQEEIERCWQELGLHQPVPAMLPAAEEADAAAPPDPLGRLNSVQLAATMAVLLNSGKRVTPWLLKAVYDQGRQQFISRSAQANPELRLLPPAKGINLRRSLMRAHASGEGFLFTARSSVMTENKGLSEHHLQELAAAALPQDNPRLLLLLAVEYGRLEPAPEHIDNSLKELGQRLLPLLAAKQEEPALAPPPAERDATNLRRFLLSRQLKQAAGEERRPEPAAAVMPDLTGLSLRKGIQRLAPYHVTLRIRGSGRIVAQKPMAGSPIVNLKLCELTLASGVKNEKESIAPTSPAPASPRAGNGAAARPAGRRDQPHRP